MSEDERNQKNNSDNTVVNGGNDICRDFLRNLCRRGKRCKYRHPESEETEKKEYVFCHDFQNKECRRPNCKFLHCTKQEEEFFHNTGKLPPHIQDAINASKDMREICKDFMKGDCRRGARCKFRHPNPDFDMGPNPRGRFERFDRGFDDFNPYEPEPKRRMFDDRFGGPPMMDRPSRGGEPLLPPPAPPVPPDYRMLEDENSLLRRKIDDLKKQVADLTATNEFLLDQNAQLRLSRHGGSGGGGHNFMERQMF